MKTATRMSMPIASRFLISGIIIRDQGSGFNPQTVPHAAREDDPIAHMNIREVLGLREGGFGLLISRGLVDEMRHNEAGNEVTLVKRFPPMRASRN